MGKGLNCLLQKLLPSRCICNCQRTHQSKLIFKPLRFAFLLQMKIIWFTEDGCFSTSAPSLFALSAFNGFSVLVSALGFCSRKFSLDDSTTVGMFDFISIGPAVKNKQKLESISDKYLTSQLTQTIMARFCPSLRETSLHHIQNSKVLRNYNIQVLEYLGKYLSTIDNYF